MVGKVCTGNTTGNSDLIKESRAFCEGVAYRAQGTAAAFPQTDNPHDLNSDAGQAWANGWFTTGGATGGVLDPDLVPCCAAPQNTILA